MDLEVLISSIIIGDRKRRDFGDIEGLANSIERLGLLNPIIIDETMHLRAGERRLRAFQYLERTHIPVRFFSNLSEHTKLEIELEENVRRKDFTWQEECAAVEAYHELWKESNPDWTFEQTADKLGFGVKWVQNRLMVARALVSAPATLAGCLGISAAINVVERYRARAIDVEVARIVDANIPALEGVIVDPGASYEPEPPLPAGVHLADFHAWASAYEGPPFHFIHLDPPYGISHDESKQGGAPRFDTYEDSPETFFRFIDTLAVNRERLLSSKSHVMVWFAMKHYSLLVTELQRLGCFRIQPTPLIWFKSDATGIAPDASREPRRVYETALLMSMGDRKIVRVVNNLFPHPVLKAKARHLSEKPEPMLRHFFQMLVDPHTRVLDPCCGAGSSLAAAVSLGAESVLGLDIDETNVGLSEIAMKKAQHHALSGSDSGDPS